MRTTLLLFLSLVGLFVTGCSGCSNERYFCDATGCYRCDGIGCRDVDPPSRPTCFGTYQCDDGQVCTEIGCVDLCDSDSDCPTGTVCASNGQCLAPTETPPTEKPGVCVRNDDCPAPPAAICLNGVCALDPVSCGSGDCVCTENADCDAGFVCSEGRCRPEEESCRFNSQCGPSRVCVDGQCFAACGPGGPSCATGFSCVDGACEPDPLPTNECQNAGECSLGEICLDSSCVPGCTTDAQCAAGLYCSSGACQPDTRPRPFCTTDAQCLGGSTCFEGVCRTPCTTDNQCQMVSGTAPFCRQRYCVTANEANSDCATSSDCPGSGMTCADGVCR